jgi:hypothetical protein
MQRPTSLPPLGPSRSLSAAALLVALATTGCDPDAKRGATSSAPPAAARTATSSPTTATTATSAASATASPDGLRAAKPKAYEPPEESKIGTLPPGIGLAVGTTAPDFELPDADGKPVSLSAITADGTVLLVFYRGGW